MLFLETKDNSADVGRQTTNTWSNLRRIQNSVYSSGKIVLTINAIGKKRNDTWVQWKLHGAHGVSLGFQVPFEIPVSNACNFWNIL